MSSFASRVRRANVCRRSDSQSHRSARCAEYRITSPARAQGTSIDALAHTELAEGMRRGVRWHPECTPIFSVVRRALMRPSIARRTLPTRSCSRQTRVSVAGGPSARCLGSDTATPHRLSTRQFVAHVERCASRDMTRGTQCCDIGVAAHERAPLVSLFFITYQLSRPLSMCSLAFAPPCQRGLISKTRDTLSDHQPTKVDGPCQIFISSHPTPFRFAMRAARCGGHTK